MTDTKTTVRFARQARRDHKDGWRRYHRGPGITGLAEESRLNGAKDDQKKAEGGKCGE